MAQFTQREFLHLDDLLHMEEMQALFAVDMANHCNDPEIRRLCLDIASKSERHFNTLLQQLSSQSAQSFQSSVQTNYTTQPSGYTYGQ